LQSALTDSSAAGAAAPGSAALPERAFTLERLLAGLARRYSGTPHADRARAMLAALRERSLQPVSLRTPPADSSPADLAAPVPATDSTSIVEAEGEEASTDEADAGRRLQIGGVQSDRAAPADERGVWVIVIASLPERAEAEAAARRARQQFEEEGVRVIPPSSRAQERYRVAVGRFGSRTEARAAQRRHQSALPADNWLLKAPQAQE
jgi:hypothetical protein